MMSVDSMIFHTQNTKLDRSDSAVEKLVSE